ncbi:MAG: DUF4908 domain-containing protein [Caulobacter sp. 35-67-4]|nr:MAG: DUF4908 domain-containing protein [Caulobacter sp. 35-67-4]
MKSSIVEMDGWRAKCVLVIVAMLAIASPVGARQTNQSLRDALLGHRGFSTSRRPPPPPVARYVSETGSALVLDRASPLPLLKFENSAEVWVLSPQPASRGDVIYRNELGEAMLRATKLGGMILFTDERPNGAAAALVGKAASIQPPSVLSPIALYQRMGQASVRASRAAQRQMPFESQDARPETSVLIAEAATVTAEAFERISRNGDRATLARITRVVLAEGDKPGAVFRNGALIVTFAPGQGVAGRPSSKRIVKVVNR